MSCSSAIFILAILCHCSGASDELKGPNFIMEPPSRVDFLNSTGAFIHCVASGNPTPKITWKLRGDISSPALDVPGLRETLPNGTLVLKPMKPEQYRQDVHASIYNCEASNPVGTVLSRDVRVTGETVPAFHDVFEELIVEKSGPVSLKCAASGNPLPQIKWKLDGLPITAENEKRLGYTLSDHIKSDGNSYIVSHLNLSSVRVEDGGLYECEARNEIGSVVHSARLNVHGKPFIRPMNDIIATAGHSLRLRCPVSGYPLEDIAWYRGSKRLPVNKRQELFPNGTLVIQDIQKQDEGTYECRASQKEQTATGTVKILVLVGPMIDPFYFPKRIQQGMRARLVCTVIQGDPPFSIQWLKNGELVDPASYSLGIRADEFSSDLTFQKVSPRYNGNYTCVVNNDVASVSHSATLVVDVAPYWKVEPSDVSVVAGSDVRIDCLAEGFPPPVITWERGSIVAPTQFVPIASGPHYEVYGNGSLLVKSADENDAGYYLCQSSNSIGPGLSKVVSLHVHTPPRFLNKFETETTRIGEEATIKCEAIGDNPMTISWKLDKQLLNTADDSRFERKDEMGERKMTSSIRIYPVKRRDSALFTCLVSNIYGKGEMNIRLIVQEPPEAPKQVKVLEKSGRVAKLSWTASFSGNSPITKYWISCRPKDTAKYGPIGHVNVSVESVLAEEESTVIVRGLRPAVAFVCNVRAENEVGLSESSPEVELITDEEVPEGPPLNIKAEPFSPRSVKIVWEHPETIYWNGKLKGYYIGYKVSGSSEQYLYKTLEISGDGNMNEVIINGLTPFTSYSVLVQAYNSMGAGPRSDEIIITTMEDVPSKGPSAVRCRTVSSQSLSVDWDSVPSEAINGILQGYRILYRPLGADISQVRERVVDLVNEIKLTNLLKYTNYSIEVVPYTRKGNGASSKPVYCRTSDDVPGAPSQIKIIVVSSDSAIVTWKDPIHKNGIIIKYTVYWKELNNNRTKTSVTVPKSRNTGYYSSFRWSDGALQYKISGLRENLAYEVWVTASTRLGEGPATNIVSVIPTKDVPTRIIEWNETVVIGAGDSFTSIVLGCHCVGTEPIQRIWRKNDVTITTTEPDGSVLLDSLAEDSANFTCTVSNQFGEDSVVYQINKSSASDRQISVKVVPTSFTTAQVYFTNEQEDSQIDVRDYEIHYRVLGSDAQEWQIKPIFKVIDNNHSVILDNLLCGTPYQLYVTELQRNIKSEVVNFRTQGSAPPAPKRDEVLKIINDSSIYIFTNAWDQSIGCPISKLVIEYRSSNYHTWKTAAIQMASSISSPVVIPNVKPKNIYSIRITANTKGAPSTMAEYEVRVGIDEKEIYFQGSGSDQRSNVIDITTIVSLASSCVVLVAGCIAVVCLFLYRKKSNSVNKKRLHKYRRQSSSSCPSNSQSDEKSERRLPVRSESGVTTSNKSIGLSSTVQNTGEKSISNRLPAPLKPPPLRSVDSTDSRSPIRGRLPSVNIPTKQLEEIEKEIQNEYDEITPYATFRLTGDDDATTEEEFKTFSVTIGEPAYMYKSSLDGAPTTSRDYKLTMYNKSRGEHSYLGINSHSLTSGSSNQEELMRAYEFGRRYQHAQHQGSLYYDEDEDEYSKSPQTSDGDTPTDPGIRRFTRTPPRPNETRQAACFTTNEDKSEKMSSGSSSTSTEESSSSVTPVNEPRLVGVFGAITRDRSRRPSWAQSTVSSDKFGPAQGNMKIGLSSDEEEELRRAGNNSREHHQKKESSSRSSKSRRTDSSSGNSQRHHRSPRIRVKRPPYRTKSKSDEIEC